MVFPLISCFVINASTTSVKFFDIANIKALDVCIFKCAPLVINNNAICLISFNIANSNGVFDVLSVKSTLAPAFINASAISVF